ncbi:MAG: hypothetical protein AAFY28_12900, partial [Actinomycetota bacterium]
RPLRRRWCRRPSAPADLVATVTIDCGDTVETLRAPLLVLVDVTFQGQPVLKVVDTNGDEVVSAGDRALVTDSPGLSCGGLGRATSPIEVNTVVVADSGGTLEVDFVTGGSWESAIVEAGAGPGGLSGRVSLDASPAAGGGRSTARNVASLEFPSSAGPGAGLGICGTGVVAVSGPGL